MKIAILAGTLKENQDGVTRVLHKQIDFFKKNEYDFTCVSPSFDQKAKGTQIKIPSISFPLYPDYKLSITSKNALLRKLSGFKPDVIYINSPCSLGLAGAKLGEAIGVPVVATYHTHFPTYLRYYGVQFLEKFVWKYLKYIYKKCDAVFVPSLSVLNNLNEKGIDNCVYLPHGVDTHRFSPKNRDNNWKRKLGLEGKKVVLFVGRIVKEKNLDILAESMEILSGKRKDISLVVAGGGPYFEEYRKRIPNSLFLGHLETEELAKVYASSDIFVFPSVTETFGNVIVEAMASGLPPVCAKSFGASELINDGQNGLLAEPNSPTSLVEKLETLLDNPFLRERISENAYQTALQLSWENILNRFNSKIVEIVEKRKKKNNIYLWENGKCSFRIDYSMF